MRGWFLATLLCLTGCFESRYLTQATAGQISLLAHARPISLVLTDSKTDPRVAQLLRWVPDVKRFGELRGLTATGNYARYTDLHRAAAVWVVQACQPLSFTSKHWSFPIAGTVPYLGFFEEKSARAFAAQLEKAEPLDVEVRGASAYSTLGWFKDPVLSTMLSDGPDALGELANVVLHESVHATFYLKGQSSFDESVASFVADRLTLEWLARRPGKESKETKTWVELQANGEARIARMHRAWETLDALYKSPVSDDEKRAQKKAIFETLRTDLGARRVYNNATLAGYRTYDTGTPAFERLLTTCHGQWKCFLTAVEGLTDDDFPTAQMEDFSEVIDRLGTGLPL